MWSRYCSRARRPAPVSRYSVFGIRPSNDFVQVTYDASSSLRACTLRLPSVVLRSALSSLKLRLSLTASALTMPRRTRSWISRSSSPVRGATAARARATSRSAASAFLAALCLATVPPGNESAEHDVQRAEARRHQPVSPRRRSEQRHGAEGHEADAHDGNDADRERAPGHEPGAVQQQPGSGERGPQARAGQRHREQTTDHHRGEKAQAGAASRSREQGIVHGERLTHHGRAADAERQHRLAQPGGEPQLGRRLASREPSRRGPPGWSCTTATGSCATCWRRSCTTRRSSWRATPSLARWSRESMSRRVLTRRYSSGITLARARATRSSITPTPIASTRYA